MQDFDEWGRFELKIWGDQYLECGARSNDREMLEFADKCYLRAQGEVYEMHGEVKPKPKCS